MFAEILALEIEVSQVLWLAQSLHLLPGKRRVIGVVRKSRLIAMISIGQPM